MANFEWVLTVGRTNGEAPLTGSFTDVAAAKLRARDLCDDDHDEEEHEYDSFVIQCPDGSQLVATGYDDYFGIEWTVKLAEIHDDSWASAKYKF